MSSILDVLYCGVFGGPCLLQVGGRPYACRVETDVLNCVSL